MWRSLTGAGKSEVLALEQAANSEATIAHLAGGLLVGRLSGAARDRPHPIAISARINPYHAIKS